MICRRCMVVMAPGTTYEREKGRNGEGKISHNRFCQCPRCKERVYSNSTNFQVTLEKISNKL